MNFIIKSHSTKEFESMFQKYENFLDNHSHLDLPSITNQKI